MFSCGLCLFLLSLFLFFFKMNEFYLLYGYNGGIFFSICHGNGLFGRLSFSNQGQKAAYLNISGRYSTVILSSFPIEAQLTYNLLP